MAFADIMKKERAKLQMTQADFAKYIGVSHRSLQRWFQSVSTELLLFLVPRAYFPRKENPNARDGDLKSQTSLCYRHSPPLPSLLPSTPGRLGTPLPP